MGSAAFRRRRRFSGALSLYAENSSEAQAYWATGVLDGSEVAVDLSKFRVLKIGTLYDNGNGNGN